KGHANSVPHKHEKIDLLWTQSHDTHRRTHVISGRLDVTNKRGDDNISDILAHNRHRATHQRVQTTYELVQHHRKRQTVRVRLRWNQNLARSEERRVGKEWRAECVQTT